MKAYDPRCHELAEYFLTGNSQFQTRFLAQKIQSAIDDGLQFLPCPECGNEVRTRWILTCDCPKGVKK